MSSNKNLYFENRYGKYKILAKNIEPSEVGPAIQKFLDEHHFKSYYTRVWTIPDGNVIWDVGSHCEFFVFGNIDGVENEI